MDPAATPRLPMAKYEMRVNTDSFNYNLCKNNCYCCIDPVRTLVEGYKSFVKEMFESCLRAKWSIGDCVVGCHNEHYNETDSTRRNSHQRRVSKELVAKLTVALSTATDFPESPENFEEIYNWVSVYVEEARKEVKNEVEKEVENLGCFDEEEVMETFEELSIHICPLLKYDTALRMSYNMAGTDGGLIPPEKNKCLPKDWVYLQRGALKGAEALLEVSQLSVQEKELTPKRSRFILKDYITEVDKFEGPCRIEISKFNDDLQSLGSYHLENFLCIYHQLFEDWAKGYEFRLEEQKKSKNK